MRGKHRRIKLICLLVILLAVLFPALPSGAQRGVSVAPGPGGAAARRVALIIGNGAYQGSPLLNSVNDARAMARTLSELGFKTILKTDLDQRGMERAITSFGEQMARGGVAVFYYAGHGVQVGGRNFLVPVGKPIRHQADVKYDAVDAGRIVDRMELAHPMLSLVILDACRDNPFRGMRGGGAGLAPMTAGEGTIIAYSTAPGSVAADGQGGNSPYTKALVQALRRPGLSVERVFKEAARQVKREYPEQVPWVNSSFTGEYFFQPSAGRVPPPVQMAGGPGPAMDQRKQNIARLLKQAEADLAAGRLSTPPGNNAYERFQKVLSLEPYNQVANQGLKRIVGRYVDLAQGRIRAGDYARAEAYLARAEKMSEGDSRVLAARDQLRGAKQSAAKPSAPAVPASAGQSARSIYRQGRRLYEQKSYTAARERFREYLRRYPQGSMAPSSQYYVGATFHRQKKYNEAILAYQEVLKRYPNSDGVAPALLRQGIAFRDLGDKHTAKIILTKVIKKYPKSPAVKLAKKVLREMAGQRSTPASSGRQNPKEIYDRGRKLYKQKSYIAARNCFEEYVAKVSKGRLVPLAYFWTGTTWDIQKEYKKAIMAYDQVIKRFPNSKAAPPSLLSKAVSLYKAGDVDGAKRILNKLIKEYPDSSMVKPAKNFLEKL